MLGKVTGVLPDPARAVLIPVIRATTVPALTLSGLTQSIFAGDAGGGEEKLLCTSGADVARRSG